MNSVIEASEESPAATDTSPAPSMSDSMRMLSLLDNRPFAGASLLTTSCTSELRELLSLLSRRVHGGI